jgi:uncharacterized protein
MMRLPALVGSPLSLNALREDVQVSHKTVARWVTILERLYYIFRIPPFGAPNIRAVKKEQKHYHINWSLVSKTGEKGRPTHLIECKNEDTGVSASLRYLKERFPKTEAWQLHATGEQEYLTDRNIHVAPAVTFLKDLI